MSSLHSPPWLKNHHGHDRHIGVEIEMGGPTLKALSQTIATLLQARVRPRGRFEHTLIDTHKRHWRIEIDSRWIKKIGREQSMDLATLRRPIEDLLLQAACRFVPLELISPPLTFKELGVIEHLIAQMRAIGARGSSDQIFNAFGMQLNPEIPSRDPAMIVAFLQSFICLQEWLQHRIGRDIARQITGYASSFPLPYIQRVLQEEYRPDQQTLIEEYLQANPTRNRALDLLPLLSYLDKRRVFRAVNDPLIKPRPTFHYRLPSSEIHLHSWGLHTVWNDWVEVERLAADTPRRQRCMAAYRAWLAHPLDRLMGSWADEVENRWLAR